jgi:hypothetical protein
MQYADTPLLAHLPDPDLARPAVPNPAVQPGLIASSN